MKVYLYSLFLFPFRLASDTLAAVRYPLDGRFYRAQVYGGNISMANVRFLDFGDKAEVSGCEVQVTCPFMAMADE